MSEVKPGLLRFAGNGFILDMNYNPKTVSPKIEFINVTDRALKEYWPDGVTRVRLEFIHPGLKGGTDSYIYTDRQKNDPYEVFSFLIYCQSIYYRPFYSQVLRLRL